MALRALQSERVHVAAIIRGWYDPGQLNPQHLSRYCGFKPRWVDQNGNLVQVDLNRSSKARARNLMETLPNQALM